MISLKPDIVCLGHGWVLTRQDASDYLKRSLAETFRYRELIENISMQPAVMLKGRFEDMAHAEYDVKGGIYQERVAYVTNLSAQVKHIAGLRDN